MLTQSCLPRAFRSLLHSLFLIFLAGSFFACAPRGETKTLSEILKNSQSYYAEASEDAQISESAKGDLDALIGDLNGLLVAKNIAPTDVKKIASLIAKLIPSAGYTNRPGFTQLEREWRELSEKDNFAENIAERPRDIQFDKSPTLRLLIARTYRSLAREVKTTGFRV